MPPPPASTRPIWSPVTAQLPAVPAVRPYPYQLAPTGNAARLLFRGPSRCPHGARVDPLRVALAHVAIQLKRGRCGRDAGLEVADVAAGLGDDLGAVASRGTRCCPSSKPPARPRARSPAPRDA